MLSKVRNFANVISNQLTNKNKTTMMLTKSQAIKLANEFTNILADNSAIEYVTNNLHNAVGEDFLVLSYKNGKYHSFYLRYGDEAVNGILNRKEISRMRKTAKRYGGHLPCLKDLKTLREVA